MIIDFVAVLLIAYGFYLGYSKGLIKTVFAAVSIIIALVAVLKLSHHVIDFLKAVLPIDERISHMIGFVLTFILVLAIIRFIGNKIEALMKSIHIGGVNKILGGSVLGLIYAVLISFGLYFLDRIEMLSPNQKQNSYTYPVLEKLPDATLKAGESLKPLFKDFWDTILETMDEVNKKSASDDEGTSN